METIEAKVSQFKAALTELYSDTISTDFVKSIVDFGTSAIEVIDNVVEKIGSLGTLAIGVGAVKGITSLVSRKSGGEHR